MKNSFFKQLLHIIPAFLVFAAPMIFNACESSADMPEKPEISVSQEEVIVGKAGGEVSFDIETNRNWLVLVSGNITGETEWCSITPSPTVAEPGTPGKYKITVTVLPEEDENADARVTTLQFVASAAGKIVKIIQSGKPIITTTAARSVYETSALIGGVWAYSGDMEIAETGAAYKLSSAAAGEYIYKVSDNNSTAQGAIDVSLTDLAMNTAYTYMAYVKDAQGNYYYGAEMQFTTTGPPTLARISELRALASANLTSSAPTMIIPQNSIVKGIVVSDPTAGNIGATQFALVDGTGQNCGIIVALPTAAENTFSMGDSLHIRVKDCVLRRMNKNNSYCMEASAAKITKTAGGNTVTPVTVVHTDLAKYEGMYVMIQNTQLTKNFESFNIWNEGVVYSYDMEVNGSDKTYGLNVLTGANFASDPVNHNSGTIKGISVISADRAAANGSTANLLPRNREDLAGLTETRFVSKLELNFSPPVFSGNLATFNATVATKLSIAYTNGDGSTIAGPISATLSGAAAEGLSVSSINNYVLAKGSGSIDLTISGIPQTPGDIVFTVTGMDAQLGANKTCTATVVVAEPPQGNFEAFGNTTGLSNAYGHADTTPLVLNSNNPAVTVTNLVSQNFNTGGTGSWSNAWGGIDWTGNTEANKLSSPAKYAYFTLTVAPGKTLSLLQFNIVTRVSGGVTNFSFQYKINNGAFIEIASLPSLGTADKLTDLSGIGDLQNLTADKTVTFRIVPIGGAAADKWAINTSTTEKSISLVGDVE